MGQNFDRLGAMEQKAIAQETERQLTKVLDRIYKDGVPTRTLEELNKYRQQSNEELAAPWNATRIAELTAAYSLALDAQRHDMAKHNVYEISGNIIADVGKRLGQEEFRERLQALISEYRDPDIKHSHGRG